MEQNGNNPFILNQHCTHVVHGKEVPVLSSWKASTWASVGQESVAHEMTSSFPHIPWTLSAAVGVKWPILAIQATMNLIFR